MIRGLKEVLIGMRAGGTLRFQEFTDSFLVLATGNFYFSMGLQVRGGL
jgi:hypothetical protein